VKHCAAVAKLEVGTVGRPWSVFGVVKAVSSANGSAEILLDAT